MEIWKPTKYKGYEVSNKGRVKAKARQVKYKDGRIANFQERILKHTINPKGYAVVYPSINGKKYSCLVHRLVAEAFIPNKDNKPQINHKDGIKTNNNVDNLEWVTNLENHQHKLENKLIPSTHMPKRVGKFDTEGNLLETFDSIYAAAKSVNASQWQVSRVVNGKRKTFRGYAWHYV